MWFLAGCGRPPSIEFTKIPEAGPGGSARMEPIAGRVTGARRGQQIVLFAKSGNWWVQPLSNKPFTSIQANSTWNNTTHLGTEYAALLVDSAFLAPNIADSLPAKGGPVIAVATVPGRPGPISPPAIPKTIRFSGYEWEVLQVPSDSGGVMHSNKASNVWTDPQGSLHLRIAREGSEWTCAEVMLTRSLGYGSYSFQVRDIPRFEPGTVLAMFTWDPLESGQNNREVDIEVSQWGDPKTKNTQYTIQPYYVPANVYRFDSPAAPLTYSFHWEPERISFQTFAKSRSIAEHSFTSGVASPGGERVHMNLYVFGKSRTPQRNGVEVVIEKFTYLP
jgi:hypothetical protein